MKKAVKLDSTKINHRIGAFMHKILHSLGEKSLQVLATLLTAAIIAMISSIWRLTSAVENHEVRIQAVEARYVSNDKLKNMELVATHASSMVVDLKYIIEKLDGKIDRVIERDTERRK